MKLNENAATQDSVDAKLREVNDAVKLIAKKHNVKIVACYLVDFIDLDGDEATAAAVTSNCDGYTGIGLSERLLKDMRDRVLC